MSKPRMYGMAGSMRKSGKRDPTNRHPRRPWTDRKGKSRPSVLMEPKGGK